MPLNHSSSISSAPDEYYSTKKILVLLNFKTVKNVIIIHMKLYRSDELLGKNVANHLSQGIVYFFDLLPKLLLPFL